MKYLLAYFAGHVIWGGVFFVSAWFLGLKIMKLEPLVGAIPLTLILGVCRLASSPLSVGVLPRWMHPKTLSSYFTPAAQEKLPDIRCLPFVVGRCSRRLQQIPES